MSLLHLRPTERISFSVSRGPAPRVHSKTGSVPRGNQQIYELRVYRCIPNRLPALLKRFETKTIRIWEKHGIRQAGFWTTVIGESNQELTYLLAWESLAARAEMDRLR